MTRIERSDERDEALSDGQRSSVSTMRRISRAAWGLVLVAFVAAVVINWLALRHGARSAAARDGGAKPPAAAVRLEDLPKAPVDMLPDTVLSYETIARQPVPGTGGVEAEAIYVTLNMDIEIQVPIAVYARVTAFDDEQAAEAALITKMAGYQADAVRIDLGHGVVARSGEDARRAAWAAAWTEGRYLLFVKSAFRDKPPVEKRQFLKNLGLPVAEAIARYARTGKQGAQR